MAKKLKNDDADKIILSRDTPDQSAEKFRTFKRPNLISHQEEWLDWDGHAYQPVEDATIQSEVQAFAENAYQIAFDEVTTKDADGNETTTKVRVLRKFNPKPSDVTAICTTLRRQNHKPADTMSPPCWLTGIDLPEAHNVISLQNGLLDMTTGELYDATPEFFTRTALPIDYDPSAPTPRKFLRFLLQVTGRDKEVCRLIQEYFGYMITGDTSLQKVFMLWGPPRTGKGTLLRIKNALTGKLNNYNPSIQEFAGRFGLESAIGKSNINFTDLNCDDRVRLSDACTRINAISGEDDVSVERKNVKSWDGRLPGRFTIVTNSLPNFGFGILALATRLIVIPFRVSFAGREDADLTDKLMVELPGILNWALAGLARLRARGRFVEPNVSKDAKTRMLYQTDPIRGFVDEKCVLDVDRHIDKDVFYYHYRRFCKDVGSHPMALNKLAERLIEIYPGIVAKKRLAGDGTRRPAFAGVGFNDDFLPRVFKLDLGRLSIMPPAHSMVLDAHGEPVPIMRVSAADVVDDFDE